MKEKVCPKCKNELDVEKLVKPYSNFNGAMYECPCCKFHIFVLKGDG